ncbi:MAG: LysR family transcriptional regulator [Sphingobium sp.]
MDADHALFATVVASGSLSAAARALGISPAMVSKRIARLELRLGTRLLHRTTRTMELTPLGEQFHRDVVELLSALEKAEARLIGAAEPRGSLVVTAPTSFGRMHVAPHLAGFLRSYPHIQLTLDLTDSFVDMVAGRIDMAIRIAQAKGMGLDGRKLATSERILCAAPDYLARNGTPETIEVLKGHRLLAAEGQWPWILARGGRTINVEGVSTVRTNSSEVVRELAVAGIGIALRSLWDVSGELKDGRLVRVLPDYGGVADLGIFAVYPASPFVPAHVRALTDYLADLYADPLW